MIIRRKERHFEFNIQSHEEVAALCRDNDMANFSELFNGTATDNIKTDIKVAIILNKGYEDHKAYEDPEYVPQYLTEEDFKFFEISRIPELEKELSDCMTKGNEISVESESPKPSGKGKNAEELKEEKSD